MNLIVDIIASIRTLFTKQPNTIYEVRLMYKQNAKKVNIFFEYYKKYKPGVYNNVVGLLMNIDYKYQRQYNKFMEQLD